MSPALPGYRLRRLIHRGKSFEVYDAWSDERDCPVVIKRVRPSAEEASSRRLITEGRRLAARTHPHLVRAYEVIREPRATVVLETLPGETLGHLFEDRGPLSAADVLQMGRQLVSVTSYLHTTGIIHADLKPGNATVSSGLVRLIDLSLAQAPGRWRRSAGTPGYLSPEQARLESVSEATDVWGLGLLLLEAASGEDPFPVGCPEYDEGVGPVASPAPLNKRRRMPAALSGLIAEMTRMDPHDRPAMADVRSAIDGMLD